MANARNGSYIWTTWITAQIRETGSPTPPPRVPSYRECLFCDIGRQDCPDRIEKQVQQEVAHGLF